MTFRFPCGLKTDHLVVLVKKFVQFIFQIYNLFILFLFLKASLLKQSGKLLIKGFRFLCHILFLFCRFLLSSFLLKKLLNLLVHFLLFILVKIDTIDAIEHDFSKPVIILDDFDNLLFLVRANNREDFSHYHFYQRRIILNQLIFEFMLIK